MSTVEEQALRLREKLWALLPAGYNLAHPGSEDDLLHTTLNDAVIALDAQRGSIVLAEGSTCSLKLRAKSHAENCPAASRPCYSQALAQRSFTTGKSILASNVEGESESKEGSCVAEGTMASVLCVLLRTPRKKLGVLHLDRGPTQQPFTKDHLQLADAMAAHLSAGIESALLRECQQKLFRGTISNLADSVRLRDSYTFLHSLRVTIYSVLLGQQLDVAPEDLEVIEMGTPLHDIGKIGIEDAILRKPGKLTKTEFEQMKTHTTKGANMLATLPSFGPMITIVRSHHERWDGRGYPDGLAGNDIPRLARIVAVANSFDSMTTDLPYRGKMPPEYAFSEMEKQKGQQFDPEVVGALLKIRQHVVQEMQSETE